MGDSETGNGATHAFVFRAGSMQDLGTLPEFNQASFARAINNQGQIVGDSESENQKRAFVYTNGVLINLTRAAINMRAAGFSALDVADGINNQGWIVGFGTTLDGRVGAFLAIPVGVTGDPPGGVNAPVADSGSVGGFIAEESIIGGGIGGGWFCPPTLWRFGWHYHFVWRTPRWRETWNREHWPNHDRIVTRTRTVTKTRAAIKDRRIMGLSLVNITRAVTRGSTTKAANRLNIMRLNRPAIPSQPLRRKSNIARIQPEH